MNFYSGKTFKPDDIQLEIAPSDFVAILLEKIKNTTTIDGGINCPRCFLVRPAGRNDLRVKVSC